jgi:hypothetical protein
VLRGEVRLAFQLGVAYAVLAQAFHRLQQVGPASSRSGRAWRSTAARHRAGGRSSWGCGAAA